MKRSTRACLRKAEADYELAVQIARGGKPFHDQLWFHCQQAAETVPSPNGWNGGLQTMERCHFVSTRGLEDY